MQLLKKFDGFRKKKSGNTIFTPCFKQGYIFQKLFHFKHLLRTVTPGYLIDGADFSLQLCKKIKANAEKRARARTHKICLLSCFAPVQPSECAQLTKTRKELSFVFLRLINVTFLAFLSKRGTIFI